MPATPTPYLFRGIELLTRLPDGINGSARTESLTITDEGFAGVHGVVSLSAADVPVPESRTLTWACTTRADLAAVEAFLGRQRGRLGAWWCPTFRQDGTSPVGYDNSSGAYLYLDMTAYFDAFATLAAQRNGLDHWAAFPSVGGLRVMSVSAVADLGGGILRLDRGGSLTGPSGAAIPGTYAGTRFSRLECVRLAEDAWTTAFRSGGIATVSATIVTTPRNTP